MRSSKVKTKTENVLHIKKINKKWKQHKKAIGNVHVSSMKAKTKLVNCEEKK